MTAAAGLGPATLATIDRWLAFQVWLSRVPGAQVAIGLDGELIFERGYGYADVEGRTPMRTDHLFRIASHSKTFTATAVLRLVEQSRLRLDDRLGDLVPELADLAIADTVLRELLEHTSGALRDGVDGDFWLGSRPFPDRAELITLAEGVKGPPGVRFAYSNIGYGLLGLVIETVTGQSYAEHLRRSVVEPLGLTDTDPAYRADRADDYAAGYSGLATAVRRRRIDHVETAALDAAAGFSSTAADLVGFFSAHRFGDDRLLSDRSKRAMQRRLNVVDPRSPEKATYGLGMAGEKLDDHQLTGHVGGYPGHVTRTLLDPEDGLVVSVLTNAIDGPASGLAAGVLALIDDARTHGPESEDLAAAAAIIGRWRCLWGAIDIGTVGARLLTLELGGWSPLEGADQLRPVEQDEFEIEAGSGYGSGGERVRLAADGSLRYGSMGFERFDELPEVPDALG